MKEENKDTGTPTERARVTIIDGETATDGNTIIRKMGDLTIRIRVLRGMMISSIFEDIVCLH